MQQGLNQVSSGQAIINYPNGFNKDNCVVISIGARHVSKDFWGYGTETKEPGAYFSGLIEKGVIFRNNDILLNLKCGGLDLGGTASEDRKDTYYYKIVLMKLPELVEGIDYVLGDVNGDGVIDNKDLTLVQNYIMETQSLTDKQFKAADVNKDNMIKTIDYMKIQNYINGTIDSFE